MKAFLLSLSFVLLPLVVAAQNYIPNPSFEDVNVCQTYVEKCCPKAWRTTTLKLHGYHAYASYRDEGVGAAQGSRYASILMFDRARDFDRKFLQVPLLCALEAGKDYRFVLHYRAEQQRVDTFGVYFADSLFISKKNKRLEGIKPQITFAHQAEFETENWHRMEGIYTATGREVGFIVGNFQPDVDTEIISFGEAVPKKQKKNQPLPPLSLYYYFDAFSLTPVEPALMACDRKLHKDYIYKDSIRHKLVKVKIWPTEKEETTRAPFSIQGFDNKTFAINATDTIEVNSPKQFQQKFFHLKEVNLLEEAFVVLDQIRLLLQQYPHLSMMVTSFTDSRGSTEYNQRITSEQAQAIVDYLVLEGVAPERLEAVGKGELGGQGIIFELRDFLGHKEP